MHSFYCEGHGAWFWVEADQSIANPASGDTTREPRVGARVKVEWVHPKLRRIEKTMEKYRKTFWRSSGSFTNSTTTAILRWYTLSMFPPIVGLCRLVWCTDNAVVPGPC